MQTADPSPLYRRAAKRVLPPLAVLGTLLLLPLLWPFALGALAAALSLPLRRRLEGRTRLRPAACGRLAVAAVLASALAAALLLVPPLLRELAALHTLLPTLRQDSAAALDLLGALLAPAVGALPQSYAAGVSEAGASVRDAVLRLFDAVSVPTRALRGLLSEAAGGSLTGGVLVVLTAFLLTPRLAAGTSFGTGRLPAALRRALSPLLTRAAALLRRSLRALPRFALRAGFVCAVGLLCGLPCPLLLALLLAAAEQLPPFGAGWLLLPAAYAGVLLERRALVGGAVLLYAGLLLLRLLPFCARKKATPERPLTLLVAAFLGYRLAGSVGLLLFPLAAAVTLPLLLPAPDCAPAA